MRATAARLLSIFLIIGQIFGGSLTGGVVGTSISNPQAYRARADDDDDRQLLSI
jgi:hypothetical protein